MTLFFVERLSFLNCIECFSVCVGEEESAAIRRRAFVNQPFVTESNEHLMNVANTLVEALLF